MRKFSIPAVAASFMALAACNEIQPTDKAAAHINGDGNIEIYNPSTGEIVATTSETMLMQSDRREFIQQTGRLPQVITSEDGNVWRGVIVLKNGFTNSVYCNKAEEICDIGSSIDSVTKYKIVEPKTPLKEMTADNFEFR